MVVGAGEEGGDEELEWVDVGPTCHVGVGLGVCVLDPVLRGSNLHRTSMGILFSLLIFPIKNKMKSRTDWIVFVKLEFDLSQLWLNQNKYVDIYSSGPPSNSPKRLIKTIY